MWDITFTLVNVPDISEFCRLVESCSLAIKVSLRKHATLFQIVTRLEAYFFLGFLLTTEGRTFEIPWKNRESTLFTNPNGWTFLLLLSWYLIMFKPKVLQFTNTNQIEYYCKYQCNQYFDNVSFHDNLKFINLKFIKKTITCLWRKWSFVTT